MSRTTGALAALLTAGLALADEFNWINPAGGVFSLSGNWQQGAPPQSLDLAVFDLDAAYTVSFNEDVTNLRLLILNDSVTLSLSDFVYSLTSTSADVFPSIVVGESGGQVGLLSIQNGTLQGVAASIGHLPGSFGEIKMSGANSTWTNTGRINVGREGHGEFHLEAGARALCLTGRVGLLQGSFGRTTIDGANSLWFCTSTLRVGDGGHGELEVTNGGEMRAFSCVVSWGSQSSGDMRISGADSLLNLAGSLQIGRESTAELKLENGGRILSTTGIVGVGSTVSVSGADSRWQMSSSFDVGVDTSASVSISAGGRIDCTTARIGGGAVAFGNGVLEIDGMDSKLVASGNVSIGLGPFVQGRVTLDNDAEIVANRVIVGNGGRLTGAGTVRADIENSNLVILGAPFGVLVVDGDYDQGAPFNGELRVQIGGHTSGVDHDLLFVQGQARLGGRLVVAFENGFAPSPGDSFPVVLAFSRDGQFDQVIVSNLPGNLELEPVYQGGNVTLVVKQGSGLVGDLNNDGKVNGADLGILITSWGACPAPPQACPADLNGDGQVNGADLGILITNWTG